jgi:hypothetical protein
VSDSVSITYQYLLTLEHLAAVMHSTPNGLRMAMRRGDRPFAIALCQVRRRLGRRMVLEARRISELIEQDHDAGALARPAVRTANASASAAKRLRAKVASATETATRAS